MKPVRPILSQAVRGAAFMLGLGAAIAALAAQGGRWSVKLDGLTHFAPIWLLGGLVSLALWLAAARRGRLTPVFAALAILGSGALMTPELVAASRVQTVAPKGETLKIVQFNVYEWNSAPEATTAWILAQDADVLIAEEVRHAGFEVLKPLSQHYAYQTDCMGHDWCPTVIMSRKPLLADGKAIALERGNGSVAWAKFAGEKGPFTVFGVHYVWPDPAAPQWINRRAMRRNVNAFAKDSLIVTGDFNSTPWSFALRRQDRDLGMTRWTRAMPSWPARLKTLPIPLPFLPIDHVYTGKDWSLVSLKRGPRLGSDHYPVVIELTR